MIFLKPMYLLCVLIALSCYNSISAQTFRSHPDRWADNGSIKIYNNGGLFHKRDVIAQVIFLPLEVVHIFQDLDLNFDSTVIHVPKDVDFIETNLINIPSWKIFSHRDAFSTKVFNRNFCSAGRKTGSIPTTQSNGKNLYASLCFISTDNRDSFSKSIILPFTSNKDIGPIKVDNIRFFHVKGVDYQPEVVEISIEDIKYSHISLHWSLKINGKLFKENWFFLPKNKDGTYQACPIYDENQSPRYFLNGNILVSDINLEAGSVRLRYTPLHDRFEFMYRPNFTYDSYLPINLKELTSCSG